MTTKSVRKQPNKKNYDIPAQVPIMGCSFVVQAEDLEGETYGETDGIGRTIKIDLRKHRNQEEVNSTLFHEIIHAVLFISGQSELLKRNQEEAIVLALEHGLFPIITLTQN